MGSQGVRGTRSLVKEIIEPLILGIYISRSRVHVESVYFCYFERGLGLGFSQKVDLPPLESMSRFLYLVLSSYVA